MGGAEAHRQERDRGSGDESHCISPWALFSPCILPSGAAFCRFRAPTGPGRTCVPRGQLPAAALLLAPARALASAYPFASAAAQEFQLLNSSRTAVGIGHVA